MDDASTGTGVLDPVRPGAGTGVHAALSALFGCALAMWMFVAGCTGAKAAEPRAADAGDLAHKRILILYAGESTQPGVTAFSDGLLEALRADQRYRVELYSEFLDMLRFPRAELFGPMERLIREKYARVGIDLVVAVGTDAFAFATQFRTTSFGPGAPLIVAVGRDEAIRAYAASPFAAAIMSRVHIARTVELALRAQPAARRLTVVAGAAPYDQVLEREARDVLRAFGARLEVRYLVGLPMAELLDALRQLPGDAAVLYLTVLQDGTGRRFNTADVAARIVAAASVPVYGIYDTHLGRGIVGGYMDRQEDLGRQTAEIGLRLLGGEDPQRIGVQDSAVRAYRVDWRALRRWGLREADLPPGADVRFRELAVWDTHRPQVLAAAGLLAFQSLLIIALLFERQRRRRIAASLHKSEDQVAVAAISANLGLWDWNLSTGSLWATDHCRALLGLGAEERLSARSLLGAIHPADRAAIRHAVDGAAASGAIFEAEFRLAEASERPRWLRATGRRVRRDGPRDPPSMTGVVIDVTARKESEREAEQQRQQLVHLTRVAALGELSGALAHELNQPLTAIVSNAEAAQKLLARERIDMEMVREIVDDIASEGTRAGAVVQRTRSMLKRSEPHREPVDLNSLVLEVLDLLRGDLIERRVSAKLQLARVPPAVRGDPVQLEQVLINLIVNACEAMSPCEPDARVVTISTGVSDGGAAQIAVADRGIGLRKDVQQQLFKPFFTTKQENLGLGLSICRWILTEHGGRLDGRNNVQPGGEPGPERAVERGATFTIELPTIAEARLAS